LPETAPATVSDAAIRAWEQALDVIERDLAEIRATGRTDDVTWSPPTDLGPLPESLARRARSLLWEQQQVAVELERALVDAAHQLNAIRVIPAGSAPKTPIYLDTTG